MTMFSSISLISSAYKNAKNIASDVEQYVGSLGSEVIKYGCTTVFACAALYLFSVATTATKTYLLKCRQEKQEYEDKDLSD